jgi:hypothetical protein
LPTPPQADGAMMMRRMDAHSLAQPRHIGLVWFRRGPRHCGEEAAKHGRTENDNHQGYEPSRVGPGEWMDPRHGSPPYDNIGEHHPGDGSDADHAGPGNEPEGVLFVVTYEAKHKSSPRLPHRMQ